MLGTLLIAALAVTTEPMRVVLSFDDALKDHILIAAPELEARGWRGVFNVITDDVGKDGDRLSWDDVRELIRRGHEVATHTASHPSLVGLLKAGREADVRKELVRSRDAIAERTGRAPRYLCAPFMQQNGQTERLASEAGLRQMNVRRYCFGKENQDDAESVVTNEAASGCRRLDLLHHGVSAADHGGWSPFRDRASFARHLDRLAELERRGVIRVTDYEGCSSSCSLGAKDWPHHGAVRLRVGVLGDTHLTTRASADILRRAFEQLRARGVTAVLVAGDLTDYGTKPSLRVFRETWDAAFGGTGVALIACTGNHDYDGWGYADMGADMRANGMSKADRLAKPDAAALAGPWKEILGLRTFEPVHVEKAGDYDCIVAEYRLPKGTLLAWMKENGARFKGEKPFLFMRHIPVQGTTRDGPYGDAEAYEALKDYPNAIAITGHSHVSFNDELALWQDRFTALSVPSLSYTCLPPSYRTHPRVPYENGDGNHYGKCRLAMPEIPYRRDLRGGQGYVLSLYDDETVVERIDFEEGVEGAPAWRLPRLGRPGTVARTESRRKAETVAPRFPSGATFACSTCNVDNRQGHWIIAMDCRFPSAVPGLGERVFEYEVRIVPEDGSAPVYKRFLSPAYGKLERDEPAVQRFWFDLADAPKGKDYHLEARAMNAFGKTSEPLRTGVWRTTDDRMPASDGRDDVRRKIRVACIGDSITFGQGMTNRVAECYPAQLQRLLGDRYEVRNFGKPGSCCYLDPKPEPGKWVPMPWRPSAEGKAAYAYRPDIVVSNLGCNDSGPYIREYIHGADGKPAVEPGRFRRDYIDLLQAFARDGDLPRIIMWTKLSPSAGNKSPSAFVMRRDLEAVAAEVGAETLDMYTPLLPYCGTAHYVDHVHPEAGAQRVIAELTAKKIQEEPAGL